MGYFSNGSEGMDYEERFCSRCVHRGDDESGGCAVWLAHLLYSYEECNSTSNAKHMLDILIPPAKDGLSNDQCVMFHFDPKSPDPNQTEMF